MRKIEFVTNEYYHIYNQGVERRNIFLNSSDYFRFLLGIKEFNDKNFTYNLGRELKKRKDSTKIAKLFGASLRTLRRYLEPLVEVVCYCLLPNHFHFILKQLEDKGISKFMHKLGTGYTNYFNLKYQRRGILFQGVFEAKHIENDAYLLHLSRYIHLNCLDLFQPDWREKGIRDKEKAFEFLKEYKWSSFPFYLDSRKPCLLKLSKEIVLSQFNTIKDYQRFTIEWMTKDMDKITSLIIEK